MITMNTILPLFLTAEAEQIRAKRQRMGLSQQAFASLLGLKESGERTVRGWELAEHQPSPATLAKINALPEEYPFKYDRKMPKFRFIDLFAGIGGIRLPFQELGGQCVFSSEWDKFAQITYAANYADVPAGDITQISVDDIPEHDVLLAGFPCQAFSQAGLKRGFQDTRGTMFFEIQRILAAKRPKAFLLENVKQLKGHDKGRTLETILSILRGMNKNDIPLDIQLSNETKSAFNQKLNYWVDFKVLRAADFGVPQNRERIYIVGFDKDYYGENVNFDEFFQWAEPPKMPTKLGNILEDLSLLTQEQDKYTISDTLWAGHQRRKAQHIHKGNGFGYSLYNEQTAYTNTLSARYYKDGSEILIDQSPLAKNPRKLTPRECARLQGFPEKFVINAVSHGQMYKQFGNSVCVSVIRAVAEKIVLAMQHAESIK